MKKILSILLLTILIICLFCGCNKADTISTDNASQISSTDNSSSGSIITDNQNNIDETTKLYMQFLNSEIMAKDSNGSLKYIDKYAIYGELPQDYRYTFFDVNFDGEKELCVSEYKYILCFRMIDDEICYYETLCDTKLLTNGAVLYDFSGVEYHQYIYKDFELEVNFEHYTDYSENTEEFYIGAALVTKEEYDEKLAKYQTIPEVDWYDQYGNIYINLPEVNEKMLSIMRNESTYIDESGNSIYLSECFANDYADDLIAKPKQFVCFDVDRDGEREFVIGITTGSEYVDHFVILDHCGDEIYGHLLGIRSLQMLKEDGTFNQSGGAAINAIARLTLDKTEIKFIVLAENFDMDGVYKIDGKDVTKQEMDAYYDQFYSKEDCKWSDAESFNLIEQ